MVTETGMVEHRDEHRRHTVQRRAAFGRHRFQCGNGIEARRRDDDAGPVRRATEVAHHHAEAMVERHRQADPIGLVVVDQLTDEVAVVQDVVMGERCPLWEAGRAGGVLDVDRIVERQLGHPLIELLGRTCVTTPDEAIPVGGSDEDRPLQRRALPRNLADHRPVVARLELGCRHQQPCTRLAQHEGQLVGAVGRVDVDEDCADCSGGVLRQYPLGAVRRPDGDPITLVDTNLEQATSDAIDISAELGIGPPPPCWSVDHRVPVAEAGDGPAQVVADRAPEQRYVRRTARV